MISVGGKSFTVDSLTLEQCLQVFLCCSYQYYHRFTSLIEDHEFDAIAKRLLGGWDSLEHRHKHLVSLDDLRAGTLYSLRSEDYPTMVVHASERWSLEKFQTDTLNGVEIGQ